MIYKMFYMNDCKYDNIMTKPNKNNYKQSKIKNNINNKNNIDLNSLEDIDSILLV